MAVAQKTKQPSRVVAAPTLKRAQPTKNLKSGAKSVAKAPKSAKPVAVKPPRAVEKAKAALKKENKVAEANPRIAVKPPKAEVKKETKKSRKISIAASTSESAPALLAKWATLYKKADQIEATPYNMKAVFEEKTAIMHKLLGWGYILANRNDRLEVLFKDGIKYLISNYKP